MRQIYKMLLDLIYTDIAPGEHPPTTRLDLIKLCVQVAILVYLLESHTNAICP